MRIVALASLLSLLSIPVASADSNRIGGSYTQRGLVVPARTLRIDAGPRLPMRPTAPMRDGTLGLAAQGEGDNTALYLNAGLAFGVTDNLDIGVLALPMLLAPDTRYGDPVLYGTYRLSRGELEAGVFVGFDLPVNDELDITAGIPLILHAGSSARVDLAALLHVRFDDNSPVDLMFPIEIAFAASRRVFVGPESGIMIADFDRVLVPLGFFVGYTLGQLGDLRGEMRLSNIGDAFDSFQLLFRAELFFDL